MCGESKHTIDDNHCRKIIVFTRTYSSIDENMKISSSYQRSATGRGIPVYIDIIQSEDSVHTTAMVSYLRSDRSKENSFVFDRVPILKYKERQRLFPCL